MPGMACPPKLAIMRPGTGAIEKNNIITHFLFDTQTGTAGGLLPSCTGPFHTSLSSMFKLLSSVLMWLRFFFSSPTLCSLMEDSFFLFLPSPLFLFFFSPLLWGPIKFKATYEQLYNINIKNNNNKNKHPKYNHGFTLHVICSRAGLTAGNLKILPQSSRPILFYLSYFLEKFLTLIIRA